MNEQDQPRMDQWTDFAGKYLKADMIAKFPVVLVCLKVDSYFDEENNAHLVFEFEYNQKRWLWECNKINQKAIKDAGIKSPKSLEMRKFTFGITKVRNPQTKAMVDSLIVLKVE